MARFPLKSAHFAYPLNSTPMGLRHYSVTRWRHHVIVSATLSLRRKQRISNCKTNDIEVYFSHRLCFIWTPCRIILHSQWTV